MEIIGKKIEKSKAVSFDGNAQITVNTINGRIALNSHAIRKSELTQEGKNIIAIAYDKDTKRTYICSSTNGIEIGENGSFTSRFHARELANFYDIKEDKFKMNLNVFPSTNPKFEGINFYNITPIIEETSENNQAVMHDYEAAINS